MRPQERAILKEMAALPKIQLGATIRRILPSSPEPRPLESAPITRCGSNASQPAPTTSDAGSGTGAS